MASTSSPWCWSAARASRAARRACSPPTGPQGLRFTLLEPWTTLVLDDARVIHESTPIQPLEGYGHRDTLVITYRAGSFQGPAALA